VNWIEIIKATFGPLIGAAIALAAIWIKESLDRKRSIQDWFEKSYIEEGVDRLISWVLLMEFMLMDIQNFGSSKTPLTSDDVQMVPTESIIKLQTIFQTEIFTNLFPALYVSVKSLTEEDGDPDEINGIINVAHVLHDGLFELRAELLKLKIHRKGEVYDISGRPEIKSALAETESKVETARNHLVEIENDLSQQQSHSKKVGRLRRSTTKRHRDS
jgi:hypothetical protein